ncbi:unnamed protein product [Urochloa decumbens]|uniref:Uncharacterized protein n=1 Tax=Urochloa decumbens TaxID=240449 RepID=A0ABC8ZDB9_9POAL
MATTTTAALSMKLLIDRKSKRVLFAEAGKDVVDFLFSLVALPVATAVKLVGTEAVVGSVGNLYASIDKLDSTYVIQAGSGAGKDALLCPTVLSPAASSSNGSLLRLPAPALPSSGGQPKSYFKCSNNYSSLYSTMSSCSSYVTDASGTTCPSCRNQMKTALKYVAPSSEQKAAAEKAASVAGGAAKGFVQGIVTYTVLDNLTVTPMSTISGITMLNTFAVRDLGDLQEKTVQLGYEEGLAILKASLESKTVLTDVFLGNKKKARRA